MIKNVMTRIFIVVILLTLVPLMGDGLDTLKVKIGDDSPAFYLRTIDNEDFFIRDYCGEKLRQPWKIALATRPWRTRKRRRWKVSIQTLKMGCFLLKKMVLY